MDPHGHTPYDIPPIHCTPSAPQCLCLLQHMALCLLVVMCAWVLHCTTYLGTSLCCTMCPSPVHCELRHPISPKVVQLQVTLLHCSSLALWTMISSSTASCTALYHLTLWGGNGEASGRGKTELSATAATRAMVEVVAVW